MSQNPKTDEESINARIQEILEHGFHEAKGYSRIPLPVESKLSQFDANTRVIVSEFLKRILEKGDTPSRHRELDYDAFHGLQLDLLSHIIYCEKTIQSLRAGRGNSKRIETLKERRRLLKLLGSTIAWLLLEFDVPYIRTLSRNDDSGFIIGKKGSPAEVMCLVARNQLDNRTFLLHHITGCLRVADLTVVDGDLHRPIEIKTDDSKKRHRLGKRERKQKQRGEMLWEFFAKKHSTKLIPGVTAIRHIVKKGDSHHWDVLSDAFLEAKEKGYSLKVAEEGIAYFVCHSYKQINSDTLSLPKSSKKTTALIGDLYDHVEGLPEIMPFTLYEIPFEMKKEILFSDILVFVIVHLNKVCETMTKLGVEARWEGHGIKYKAHGLESVMSGNLLDRLRYECLSVKTLRDYALSPIPKSLLRKVLGKNELPSRDRPSSLYHALTAGRM